MIQSLYPPKPTLLPEGFNKLSKFYLLRAGLAIGSIFLFFILYLLMVAGFGYFAWWSVFELPFDSFLLKIGVMGGAIMLFLFSLKFVFGLSNHDPGNRILLNPAEEPALFEFIHRICEETGAPKPRRIYLDPDVNAYVAYSNHWLSLFLPVKKDLTIGLALVHCLNMSEFKAVMAHEFGHFAQSSMKIGSYIHSANTIIHDMIFNRDRWDMWLERWRAQDLIISFAAWGITLLVWLIRKLLELFYTLLNFMYSSLSREMEFNADKVAVSSAGSVAIVSALWKLEQCMPAWQKTTQMAYDASLKQVFTPNLYHHYKGMLLREKLSFDSAFQQLTEDEHGSKRFFTGSADSKVGMYASHPSNDMREDNAKTPFIPAEFREDQPALLFSNLNAAEEALTGVVYRSYLGKELPGAASDADFETFIEEEGRGEELMAELHQTYLERYMKVLNPDQYEPYKPSQEADVKLLISHLREELKALMEPVAELNSKLSKVMEIVQGTSKSNTLMFNDVQYGKSDMEAAWQALMEKKQHYFEATLPDWDSRYIAAHLALAEQQGDREYCLRLLAQYKAIAAYLQKLFEWKNEIIGRLESLQQRDDVEEQEINDFAFYVNDCAKKINQATDDLASIDFIPMANIATTEELIQSIFPEGKLGSGGPIMFEDGHFSNVLRQLELAILHTQRMDAKCIRVILEKFKGLEG